MAANRQQGTYLGTTLVGFTAFPAGLAIGGSKGHADRNCGAGNPRDLGSRLLSRQERSVNQYSSQTSIRSNL